MTQPARVLAQRQMLAALSCQPSAAAASHTKLTALRASRSAAAYAVRAAASASPGSAMAMSREMQRASTAAPAADTTIRASPSSRLKDKVHLYASPKKCQRKSALHALVSARVEISARDFGMDSWRSTCTLTHTTSHASTHDQTYRTQLHPRQTGCAPSSLQRSGTLGCSLQTRKWPQSSGCAQSLSCPGEAPA